MRRVAAALVLALALAALPFPVLADVPEVPFGSACGVGVDFPIDGGWFFTQTGSDTGRGYPVVDDDAAKFWSAFQGARRHPSRGLSGIAPLSCCMAFWCKRFRRWCCSGTRPKAA